MHHRLFDWMLVVVTWTFGTVGVIAEAVNAPNASVAGIAGGLITLAALWLKLRYNTEALQARVAAKDETIAALRGELTAIRAPFASSPPDRTATPTPRRDDA